ncbi:hypothetical protein [Flavobacterium ovatum]|uniref:hypothetical protein n=1 Tax=Flavobacterium ovatum TaxID=1928857 RepID=UPI00344EBDD3
MKVFLYLGIVFSLFSCGKQLNQVSDKAQKPFPLYLKDLDPNRKLSSATERSLKKYDAPLLLDNELYTNFRYTELEGFNYNNGDGTISRRDPSRMIFENGKYYVWYTYRETATPPRGYEGSSETIPYRDWDLCEIWYTISTEGFTWKEQGIAVNRPDSPNIGHLSVATADILKWKGKFYLYY